VCVCVWVHVCVCVGTRVCVCGYTCVCVCFVLHLSYFGEINMDYDGDSENYLSAGKSFHLDMANCSIGLHSVCTTFYTYVISL